MLSAYAHSLSGFPLKSESFAAPPPWAAGCFSKASRRSASFPASILTVDRITGEFDGPYQVIEDLDELFAQGYHRTLLHREETYGPNGREVRNTLAPYRPDTFVREYGFYHQGVPQPN